MTKRLALIGNQAFSLVNFRGSLLRDLALHGVTCFALAPGYTEETREAVRALGATPVDLMLSRTGMNPVRDVLAYREILSLLHDIRPEITLSYASKPVVLGTLASKAAEVPRSFAMVEGLGWAFGKGGGRLEETVKRKIARTASIFLYRRALKTADKVFFLNEADVLDFVSERLVRPNQPIMLGGIGVDINYWTRRVRKPDVPTFVLMARMIREKGVYDFVAAARQLKQEGIRARFMLLGGLDSNPSAIPRTEIESWVQSGIVEWHGHVEPKAWLEKASVFVLPSFYREGVPRSIQEAMALEMPIITTDIPGCRDTVDDGLNGILVPPMDPAALAAAMRHLARSPTEIERMGKASREKAVEKFDDRRVNARIIDAMNL